MKEITIQQCKDESAKEQGYKNWEEGYLKNGGDDFKRMIDRAFELYASQFKNFPEISEKKSVEEISELPTDEQEKLEAKKWADVFKDKEHLIAESSNYAGQERMRQLASKIIAKKDEQSDIIVTQRDFWKDNSVKLKAELSQKNEEIEHLKGITEICPSCQDDESKMPCQLCDNMGRIPLKSNGAELPSDEKKKREKTEIDNVVVYSLEQTYDDGRKEIFSIGDETDIGKVVSFEKKNDFWMALGSNPSEWQKNRGMKNSWSWILQLEKLHPIKPKKSIEECKDEVAKKYCEIIDLEILDWKQFFHQAGSEVIFQMEDEAMQIYYEQGKSSLIELPSAEEMDELFKSDKYLKDFEKRCWDISKTESARLFYRWLRSQLKQTEPQDKEGKKKL